MSNKKDLNYKLCILIAVAATVVRIFIARQQMLYIMPGSAPIDDDLYFKWANSIVAGEWLGRYNYLTLSKYPFFAVYLAALHNLKIPYLVANAVLYVTVCGLCVWALFPILKRNYHRLAAYILLIYSPASMDKYNLRVYRDSIYPILCLGFFGCVVGWALRLKEKSVKNIPFLVLAGLFMALGYITREDGYWLIPFGVVAAIICAVYIIIDRELDKKRLRLSAMVIPAVMTLIAVFTICNINDKYYGEFLLTDFNSGPFAQCYGNMTRLPQENWHPLVDVPKDARRLMYENCPAFAPFKEHLEDGSEIRGGFYRSDVDDYYSGSFYWMLRFTAQYLGQYENLTDTQKFWAQLSDEVAALRNETEGSLKPRSSLTPPIRAEYVKPVVGEAVNSLIFVLTLKDIMGYNPVLSDNYTGQVDKWHDFLYTMSNYSAIEYTDIPYHTNVQNIVFKGIDTLVNLYRLIFPLSLILAVACVVYGFVKFKNLSQVRQIATFVVLGLTLMAIFRIFIIAFMEVAAFNIGTQAMYLGCVYPMLLLGGVTATGIFTKD